MLKFAATNDKALLDKLSLAATGVPFDGTVGYVLTLNDVGIGVAKLQVSPEVSTIVSVAVVPELRGRGLGDFFTRSLMNVLIDVTERIETAYQSEYFVQFGFRANERGMTIESKDLTFPHACQCHAKGEKQ